MDLSTNNTESFHGQAKVVKIRDGVGFRPQSDLPFLERAIAELKYRPIVIEDLKVAASCSDSKGMPTSDLDNVIEVLKDMPDAFRHAVNTNVLFQRIRPRQIIVAIVPRARQIKPPPISAFPSIAKKETASSRSADSEPLIKSNL